MLGLVACGLSGYFIKKSGDSVLDEKYLNLHRLLVLLAGFICWAGAVATFFGCTNWCIRKSDPVQKTLAAFEDLQAFKKTGGTFEDWENPHPEIDEERKYEAMNLANLCVKFWSGAGSCDLLCQLRIIAGL